MSQPKISVVLGCYNQKDVLKRVLESFDRQHAPSADYEVIVVDSSSTDGTDVLLKEWSPRHKFKGIIQENKGKSGARNRGVHEASGDLILITDSDMIAHENLIETHLKAHKSATGPTSFEGVTMNMTELHWPPVQDKLYPYITKDYKDGAKLGWYYFLTGNISFPKSVFDELGGFDEDFQVYGWEDLELGYRFQKAGIPHYFLKSAVNYHYHIVSKEGEIERNFKKGESAKIFLDKHPELKWFLGCNPLSLFVHGAVDQDGKVINALKSKGLSSSNEMIKGFSRWFLGEYNYLNGITQKRDSLPM
jgi:GT2 family glycosyltransferase